MVAFEEPIKLIHRRLRCGEAFEGVGGEHRADDGIYLLRDMLCTTLLD
jgi:hypothetical protein